MPIATIPRGVAPILSVPGLTFGHFQRGSAVLVTRSGSRTFPVPYSRMVYRIIVEATFLRAELLDRETMEEARAFFQVVFRESVTHRRPFILIKNRSLTPILRVEYHAMIESFKDLAQTPSHRIALLGDTGYTGMPHEYVGSYARRRGLNVRSFADEAAALEWFSDRRQGTDRRRRQEVYEHQERRRQLDRRQPRQGGGAETHH